MLPYKKKRCHTPRLKEENHVGLCVRSIKIHQLICIFRLTSFATKSISNASSMMCFLTWKKGFLKKLCIGDDLHGRNRSFKIKWVPYIRNQFLILKNYYLTSTTFYNSITHLFLKEVLIIYFFNLENSNLKVYLRKLNLMSHKLITCWFLVFNIL